MSALSFQVRAQQITSDRFLFRSYATSFGLVVIMAVMIGVSWRWLPSEVPLFFSKPWGEDRLVNTPFLLLLPGIAMGVILLNLLVTSLLTKTGELLGKSMATAAFLFTLMTTVSLLQILRTIL